MQKKSWGRDRLDVINFFNKMGTSSEFFSSISLLLLKDNEKSKLINQAELVLEHKMPISEFHSLNYHSYDMLSQKDKINKKSALFRLKSQYILAEESMNFFITNDYFKLIYKNNFKFFGNKLNSMLELIRGNANLLVSYKLTFSY